MASYWHISAATWAALLSASRLFTEKRAEKKESSLMGSPLNG